ncbi:MULTISPECIES: LysR family transcriptional regulator [Corynebacterium]|uniref:Transcriptional regulator n=1 Tax=Corynebacterium singulare TaxID=161899 RepID=A0A0B6EXX5_9CORY|nr:MULTISPECIES: LysR family transcriptional regulator [Corynebacterium]AJI79638.1 transcriptional regulator [Corynebacterium singulare]MCG7275592.1 LysR family transcriptional regulator [Corynebacterium singulare]
MDSRQLHHFRTIVDHGSFTQAAETLRLTQPSLSLTVRKLEEDLNVKLLSRGRGGVKTTEAGEFLYGVATSIDSLLATATTRLAEIAAGSAGSVTLCSAPEFNWLFMPTVLRRMRQRAPQVNVSLSDLEPTATLKRVLDGSVEIGIIPSTNPQHFQNRYGDQLAISRAADMEFRVALPQRLSHLPDPVRLSSLTTETWLLPPRWPELSGLPELLDQLWATSPDCKPAIVQEISTLQTGLPLVAGDYGISLMPHTAQALGQRGVHFHRIEEPLPSMEALLIYRADRALTPAAQTLIDILLDTASHSPAELPTDGAIVGLPPAS